MPDASRPPMGIAWDQDALANPHEQRDKAVRVEAMFDAIAPTYERVNAVASFGRDATWRRRAIAAAGVRATDVVLDIACGTGDMIRAFARSNPRPARIIGLDFAAGMLASGRFDIAELRKPVELLRGDALRLPLANASVDVVSCAFGVRNFQDLQRGLNEMSRVVRPSGRVIILEFSVPQNPLLRWPYRLYTEFVLPRLGSLISRDTKGAYRYLPSSIESFESPNGLEDRLKLSGLADVRSRRMNLGGVTLLTGRKP